MEEEENSSTPTESGNIKPKNPASGGTKNDLLYEYYSEYADEDLSDVGGLEKKDNVVVVATVRPIDVHEAEEKESVPADKSDIIPPSYIFIITSSALVSIL
jgi:hypothetical protein